MEDAPFRPILDFRAIICDMDGLLLDTERLSYEAWLSTASSYGFDIRPIYPSLIGKGIAHCDDVLRTCIGPKFQVEEVRRKKDRALGEIIERQGIPIKPGAVELLDFLGSNGLKTALATSSYRKEALYRIRRSGLEWYFNAAAYGDDVFNAKPAPDLFIAAAKRLEIEACDCLVLEDSHAGVQSAICANMSVIMIPDLVPVQTWVAERGVQVLPSLYELLPNVTDLQSAWSSGVRR